MLLLLAPPYVATAQDKTTFNLSREEFKKVRDELKIKDLEALK